MYLAVPSQTYDEYRKLVKQVLQQHAAIKPAYGEIEVGTLFDQESDPSELGKANRYQVMRSGWLKERRVYGALIHIDLKDSKCWIQYDGTEVGVANELVELGIPKEDIVLAYHAPLLREYGEFAVG